MRFVFATVVTVFCAAVLFVVDRASASRAQRQGAPVRFHPLTIDHRPIPYWQWALGIGVLFVVAFGASGAIGIG